MVLQPKVTLHFEGLPSPLNCHLHIQIAMAVSHFFKQKDRGRDGSFKLLGLSKSLAEGPSKSLANKAEVVAKQKELDLETTKNEAKDADDDATEAEEKLEKAQKEAREWRQIRDTEARMWKFSWTKRGKTQAAGGSNEAKASGRLRACTMKQPIKGSSRCSRPTIINQGWL